MLPKEDKNRIQKIVEKFLYYSRAVYPPMLVDLRSISDNQANINDTTAEAIKQVLYECATHPDATIIYNQSNMVIHIHSYGSHLS